jgi:eukaryotic-like serine/threonine-protein kinase
MPALTDVPRSSEEWRAFLQSRVSGFGRILASFVLGFYVFANSAAMLHPLARWSDWIGPLNLLVLGAGTICAAVWIICRASRRSTSELETIDLIATIATGASIGLTAIYAPPVQRPELAAIMGVIIFLILRAIVIPSTGPRTTVLSALSVLPAIYAAYECHAREAKTDYTLPLPLYPALTAVWAGLGVMAATLASRTIFGLRKKASEAQKLGQYTLGAKIGEGGMGAVYRASHAMMKREVAIKLLPADRAGKEGLVRFEREVQLTSRLNSPNTIAIYDYGRTPQGVFYYVMEYIDGFSLEDLVAKFGPLPPGRVVHLVKQVCAALSEAHSIGLIHRDIKPANIALCERAGVFDVVKVLDFGLVKELGTDSASTTTAALTGTPLYLAPESITAPDKVDNRSDLYAVGGVAFWLLTGTHVFEGSTIVEVCSHHLHTKPETPSVRLGQPVPADLEAVILKCLEKEPAKRYASADELAHALDACDSAEDWSDDLATDWWRLHRDEADEARPKISRPSRLPGPIAVDLEGRAGLSETAAPADAGVVEEEEHA